MTSQQVSWWSVREYVVGLIAVEDWPLLGSPSWCALADDDPVKLAAVLDAAQHWALRLETAQAALADAGSEISAAADWSHIAEYIHAERAWYAAHPWMRRAS